jgi:RNase adaptor protein for sRNA GlmZ degradation
MAHPHLGYNANLFPQVPDGKRPVHQQRRQEQNIAADVRSRGPTMTVNEQPTMVDEQAIIVFLRQLDRALAAARRTDEPQRRHRLTLIQSLVMAVLADPRHLAQALRQAADGLAHLDS